MIQSAPSLKSIAANPALAPLAEHFWGPELDSDDPLPGPQWLLAPLSAPKPAPAHVAVEASAGLTASALLPTAEDSALKTAAPQQIEMAQSEPAVIETGWTSEDMFSRMPVRGYLSPTFTDLDGDGDEDMVVGCYYGEVVAFRNGTDGASGVFNIWDTVENPFASVDATYMATPTFVDFDGDGDQDMVVGSRDAGLFLYRNGTIATSGDFTDVGTIWRFSNVMQPGLAIDPAFSDLDGDGDQDMVMGDGYGNLISYRNGTSGGSGVYKLWGTGDPLTGLTVSGGSTPEFIDLDSDGDLDLVTGTRDGRLVSFRNGTDGASGTFKVWTGKDPFAGLDIGLRSDPAFADLDGDGDLDLVTGSYDYIMYAYENVAAPNSDPVFDFDQSSTAFELNAMAATDTFDF